MSKNNTLSAKEYLQQEPLEEDIEVRHGAQHIPIHPLQESLDYFEWSTQNFQFHLYKDGYANLCVAASLELVLSGYHHEPGYRACRTFVGAANFSLASLGPIENFMGAIKSLCIKNAAADAGRKLGRGLNSEVLPEWKNERKDAPKPKMKPDKFILQQYIDAVKNNDTNLLRTLTDIYELNPPKNGDETI